MLGVDLLQVPSRWVMYVCVCSCFIRDGLVEILRAMLSMHRHPPETLKNDQDKKKEGGTPEDEEGTQDDVELNPRVLTPDQVCWI